MKRLYIAAALIVILGMSLAIIVPALINHTVQTTVIQTIRTDYNLKECTYVRVDPGVSSLLSGKIDRIYIECPKSEFNDVEVKNIVVTLKDISFDLKSLIFTGKVKVKRIGSATARMAIDEAEINRYIASNHEDLKGWTVGLKPNQVVATANIEIIGRLDVIFKPRLRDGKLVLELVDAQFAGISSLGLDDARNWIDDIGFDVPVSNLPFDMKVTKVMVQEEQLMVTARN